MLKVTKNHHLQDANDLMVMDRHEDVATARTRF